MKIPIEKLLHDAGAIQTGHFRLQSGLHASQYLQCLIALTQPTLAEQLGERLAKPFQNDRIDSVLAMNPGGTILGFVTAHRLAARLLVAIQDSQGVRLLRGQEIRHSDRVLVVDDVTTTGSSVRQLMEVAKADGGEVAGVGLLATKGLVDLSLGVKTAVLASLTGFDAVPASECPQCRRGVPLEEPR